MRQHLLAAAAALFTLCGSAWATQVDVELVLAVDTSGSIDGEEYQMQHEGYAEAFSSDAVVEAIQSGAHRAIAVTYVEWSGLGHQKQLVGWTIIKDKKDAEAFGARIKEANRSYSDWTSISDAIDFSAKLFDGNGFEGERLVLDISGDGINNNGRPVQAARDDAVAKGIIINGLPILNEDPTLDKYFSENVIGGPGSFKVAVQDFDTFTSSLMSKLVREIAGVTAQPFNYAGLY
jgi:hypothetical protein